METKTNNNSEQELLQQPLDEKELDQVAGGYGVPKIGIGKK